MESIPKKGLFDFKKSYLYEFELNEANELVLNLYIERIESNNESQKRESRNERTLIKSICAPNIKECLTELKKKGFVSSIKSDHFDFKLKSLNPIKGLEEYYLMLNCQLLQKVYDEVIVENMRIVITYLVYVNVHTGKIGYKKQEAKVWDEDMINHLASEGYIHFGESYLVDHMENTSSKGRI